MPKFRLEMLFYTMFAIGFSLLIGSSLTHCQSDPITTRQQPSLPVQDNFEHEKIWTDEDFSAAEIDPLDVNYNVIGNYPPDTMTDETVRLISEHNHKQLQRLTAGATQ